MPPAQSPRVVGNAAPAPLEIVASEKQISSPVASKLTLTKTPSLGGIVAPVSEKPSTIVPLFETVKPLDRAKPPDAPVIWAPESPNWKPPTASLFDIRTSTFPLSISISPNDRFTLATTVENASIDKTIKFLNMLYLPLFL